MSSAFRFWQITTYVLLFLFVSSCGGGGGGGAGGGESPPATMPVIATGTVGPTGGVVSDPWGETAVLVPPGSLASSALIEIRQGRDSSGYVTTTISSSAPTTVPVSILLPPPPVLENSVARSAASLAQVAPQVAQAIGAAVSAYPITSGSTRFDCPDAGWDTKTDWFRRCSYFIVDPLSSDPLSLGAGGIGNRVDSGVAKSILKLIATHRPAAFLSSYCRFDDSQCYVGKEPVLFVHGFLPTSEFSSDNGFGGGEGTWGEFPEEIKPASSNYVPFEFRWVTAARFQDVAVDLGSAIDQIAQRTGKKVHVIAHSFGGVLTRVYLQGLAADNSYNENVATLTTLGSPHSGNFDGDTWRDGVQFKRGQDAWGFETCRQLSCYQMGEDVQLIPKELLHVDNDPGEIAAKIYRTIDKLPDLPIQVLIGLTTLRYNNDLLDTGDGLITYEGQRFLANGGDGDSLASSRTIGKNAKLTERILGTNADVRPGGSNPYDPLINKTTGYRHSKLINPGGAIPMACVGTSGCNDGVAASTHDGLIKARSWIVGIPAATDVDKARFTITGILKDASTGASLQNVTAYLTNSPPGLGVGSVGTANDGSFSLEVEFSPNASYEVSFYKRGYDRTTRTIVSTLSPPSGALGAIALQPAAGPIQPKTYTLSVSIAGSGAVTALGGISCPSVCTVDYREGERVALSALPYEDLSFTGWTSCDEAVGTVCRITMNGNKSITATFGAPLPTAPAAPNNFQATALSASKVLLVWQDRAIGESGFRVERKTGVGGTFAPITTRAALAGYGSWAYYEDVSVSAGTDYCYTVVAYDAAGNESTTNPEACATTPSSGGPIGGPIAFFSLRDGNAEIYAMNADGTGQTRLTNNAAWDGGHAWSPDGSQIVFQSDRDGNREIYVMNADGSGQTRLTYYSSVDLVRAGAWSPNGSQIIFESDRDGNWEIYVMNVNGSGQARLTNNAASDKYPVWSPNGAKIAFSSERDGTGVGEIYVMNADGSNQTRLTNNAASDLDPAWSPDGNKIAFASARDGNFEIYVMNADGSNQTRLTNNAASDRAPAWSPDGSQIVFFSHRDGNDEIYVMNADGSGQTRLTNNSADDRDPAWRPTP